MFLEAADCIYQNLTLLQHLGYLSWAILAGITADLVLSKVISIILSFGNFLTSSKETKYLEGSYPFWSHWSSVSLY